MAAFTIHIHATIEVDNTSKQDALAHVKERVTGFAAFERASGLVPGDYAVEVVDEEGHVTRLKAPHLATMDIAEQWLADRN